MKNCILEFLRVYLPPAIPELLGGLLALVCAIIGAKTAAAGSLEQSRRTVLRDAYADLFAQIFSVFREATVQGEPSDQAVLLLTVAANRVMLTSSERAEQIISDLLPALLTDHINIQAVGRLTEELRLEAQKDLKTRRRHKKEKPTGHKG